MRNRTAALLAALAVSTAVLSAPAAQAAPAGDTGTTTVTALLAAIPVAPETASGYDRADFKHWTTTDGCDTRQWVLIRQAKGGVRKGCDIVGGTWYSPYDGQITTNPRTFDIDHMVPLKEAFESGAANWSADQRMYYANDLTYRPALNAVSASSNRAKGDQDPAQWMPPLASDRCTYLKDWVGVKYRWGLSMDTVEKKFIVRAVKACPQAMTKPPVAPVSNGPVPTPKPQPTVKPSPKPSGNLDPRFRTCGEANKAGYGPYTKGVNPEYAWYSDRDGDGVVCER